ncbi:MAG: adenylyltransferase/cytidyltransferase family protein, partial [Phycisphaerales bacterium]
MTPIEPPPPPDAAPLVLFGGTFDPPHLGHAHIARHALAASGPHAWILFVPAARSPLKTDAPAAP